MKVISKIMVGLSLLMVTGLMVATPVFLVTNTNDSGEGSLRQAVADSEAMYNEPDTVPFNHVIVVNVPGAIRLNSDIHIAHPVSINGNVPGISIIGGRIIFDPGSEGSEIRNIFESTSHALKTEEQRETMW